MRSLATRSYQAEVSEALAESILVAQAAGFDPSAGAKSPAYKSGTPFRFHIINGK
jgi:hypothetical protein